MDKTDAHGITEEPSAKAQVEAVVDSFKDKIGDVVHETIFHSENVDASGDVVSRTIEDVDTE